jgi:hypothetical protein
VPSDQVIVIPVGTASLCGLKIHSMLPVVPAGHASAPFLPFQQSLPAPLTQDVEVALSVCATDWTEPALEWTYA